MAVNDLDDGATCLDESSFESTIHGQRGRSEADGQRNDVVVRMGNPFWAIDHRSPFIQQVEQQTSALSVEGLEFKPDTCGNQPCRAADQRKQGMVKVDVGINRRGPAAGVDDQFHVLASDDRGVSNEAPAGAGAA